VIRRFHVLLKEKAKLENGQASAAKSAKIANIERDIRELGGLELYQRMSAIGQGEDRGGGSEKFLISWLKELRLAQTKTDTSRKLRYVLQ
jgi:25S rRNA (adenine2142-N1)-methyltransferase